MWLILDILFLLLEVCHAWRFYAALVSALLLVGLGAWLLPEESAWRGAALPVIGGGVIAGLVWEVVVARRKNYNPAIVTLDHKAALWKTKDKVMGQLEPVPSRVWRSPKALIRQRPERRTGSR